MNSVEHKVDMFHLAQERRRQGLPQWRYTIRGFKDILASFDEDSDNFLEIRDRAVERIRSSKWFRDQDDFSELHDLIDEWSDVGHPDIDWGDDYDRSRHFNDCLDRLYDLADWDRAWLA